MRKVSRKSEISLRLLQNLVIYLYNIAYIWLLGIYNCCSIMLRRWEEWYQKVFSLLCYPSCAKLAKKLKFLCNYFKINQNLVIYGHTIVSIWLLGIYNWCSNMLRSWEEWYQKVFSLPCNSTCAKLVENPKFLYDYFKMWLFICIILLIFDS